MMEDSKSRRLNDAFGYVEDRFLDIVELEKGQKKRKRMPALVRFGSVAAVVCLMISLPAWALANGWLGLKGILLYEENRGIEDGAGGRLVEYIMPVSLSGYRDSVESQALAEWNAYVEEYIATHELDNEFYKTHWEQATGDWRLYQVYSVEMGEKLEEIAVKYGLKLHTQFDDVSPQELEERIGGSYLAGNGNRTWGYIYEDGSFQTDGTAVLDQGAVVPDYQFRRVVKGTFDDVVLNIGQPDDYIDWQYTTASGVRVLLAISSHKALIFADLENCFISVNVLAGSDAGISRENLQEMADLINFPLLADTSQ